jgi:hypothetical protein
MNFEGRLLAESSVFYHPKKDDNENQDNDDENKKNYHDKGRALCMVLVNEVLDEGLIDCDNNHDENDNKKIKNNGELTLYKKKTQSKNMYDLRNKKLPKKSKNRILEEMLLIGTDRGILHGFNTTTAGKSNNGQNNDQNHGNLSQKEFLSSFIYRTEKYDTNSIEIMKFRSYVVEIKLNNNIQKKKSEKNASEKKNAFEEIFADKNKVDDIDDKIETFERKELFIIYNENKILTNLKKTLKIYSLPFMTCTHVLSDILNLSCLEISYTLHWFCTCHNDGTNKLYEVINDDIHDKLIQFKLIFEDEDIDGYESTNNRLITDTNIDTKTKNRNDNSKNVNEIIEVTYTSSTAHTDKIIAVAFHDELEVYVTSSLDCSIRIWNFKKCQLNCLLYQNPSVSLLFYGDEDLHPIDSQPNHYNKDKNENKNYPNNLLISQKSYLLNVDKNVWDYNNNVKEKNNDDVNGLDGNKDIGIMHEIVDLFLLKKDSTCINHILINDDNGNNHTTQKGFLNHYDKIIDAPGDEILMRNLNNVPLTTQNLNICTQKLEIDNYEYVDLVPPPPVSTDIRIFPSVNNPLKNNNKNLNHEFNTKLIPLHTRISGKTFNVRVPNILTRGKFGSKNKTPPQNNSENSFFLKNEKITENEGIVNDKKFDFEISDSERCDNKEDHTVGPELIPSQPKQINHSKSSCRKNQSYYN